MTTTPSPKPSKLYVIETSKHPDSSTLDEKLGRCLICHARWTLTSRVPFTATCPSASADGHGPQAETICLKPVPMTTGETKVIAAIYTRKSNEQEQGPSGATESIERQIESAREFAASKGWTIEPEQCTSTT